MAAATWRIRDLVGAQQIDVTDTVQRHELGKRCKAWSDTYGEGEFIYLLGAASTVVGLAYSYNATTYQTVVLPNTANLDTPVVWAMSANVASQYGWYQEAGLVVAKKTNVSWEPQKAAFISATAGRVMDTVASGKQILNAKSANLATVTTTTSTIVLLVNRPFAQGQVI